MGKFLAVKNLKGSYAIAVCQRCAKKVYYGDLVKDPNNGAYYCPQCVDIYDPWRLPARRTEDISLNHPRPDTELS